MLKAGHNNDIYYRLIHTNWLNQCLAQACCRVLYAVIRPTVIQSLHRQCHMVNDGLCWLGDLSEHLTMPRHVAFPNFGLRLTSECSLSRYEGVWSQTWADAHQDAQPMFGGQKLPSSRSYNKDVCDRSFWGNVVTVVSRTWGHDVHAFCAHTSSALGSQAYKSLPYILQQLPAQSRCLCKQVL